MRIWLPVESRARPFAEAGPYGRRKYESFELGYDINGQPEKFTLEWRPDSDVIGDFVWPNGSSWIVTRRTIGEAIKAHWPSVELGPVDFWQEPKLYELKRKPRKPRVLLPYTGPELVYLRPTARVEFDRERSRVQINKDAKGDETFGPVDVETFKFVDVTEKGTPGYVRVPRKPGGGFFVPVATVEEQGIFIINGIHAPHAYITDVVKTFIESQGWTNIEFREHGETF